MSDGAVQAGHRAEGIRANKQAPSSQTGVTESAAGLKAIASATGLKVLTSKVDDYPSSAKSVTKREC